MILTALLALLFLACAALSFRQGAWSSLLCFFNMVFAALLASSFFEFLATKVEEQNANSYRFLTDFLVWWGLFALTFVFMRMFTDKISKEQVEYAKIAEYIVGGLMAVANGWLFVCLVSMSLHMAPLNARPFKDVDLTQPTFLGLSPDRMWLGFVGHQSRNIMQGSNEFSGDRFRQNHLQRRAEFESTEAYRVP